MPPAPLPRSRVDAVDPVRRSLADELRSWDDGELVALLDRRTDLAVPTPGDLTELANRAGGRASVHRAMDRLDTAALQVLQVLTVLPEPVDVAEVSRRWGAPAEGTVDRLRALALVWGPPDALRLVRSARELVGPLPGGLGPPLAEALDRRSPQRLADLLEDLGLPPTGDPVTATQRLATHLGDPVAVESLLRRAPAGAQEVLARLTWDTPVGTVERADREIRAGTATSPVEWLLAHGLLAVADPGHVVLPREVGLALRGGVVFAVPSSDPPTVPARPARQVDGAAGTAAGELVRLVEELCRRWELAPPPVLRSGGLGVRELRRLATTLTVDDPTAAVVIEVAAAAGLVAEDGTVDPRWAPTPTFDTWCTHTPGRRWADLAAAWLTTTRVPHLVGSRDPRSSPRAVLGPDLDQGLAPVVRAAVLRELATATDRTGHPGAVDPADLRDRLEWFTPRRAVSPALVTAALDEAALLGLTGSGALSGPGLVLVGDQSPVAVDAPVRPDVEAAAKAMDAVLPAPVDHLLLQADLTAVVPGPPTPDLAAELDLVADAESRGGASVYRFSESSLRRALDAGRSADEVLRLLRARSRTPVPQPLEYLVSDVARRHGRIRVGTAGAYVRADDEALLGELLGDRRAAGLRLRRIAPTVLVSQADPEQVVRVLRELGRAPAAETLDGEVVVTRPPVHRAPDRPAVSGRTGSRPDPGILAGVVRLLRSIERGPEEPAPNGTPPELSEPADPSRTLATLRAAAAARHPVWIGLVDQHGTITRLLVEPLLMDGGRLQAMSDGRARIFPIHRIVGAVPVSGTSPGRLTNKDPGKGTGTCPGGHSYVQQPRN